MQRRSLRILCASATSLRQALFVVAIVATGHASEGDEFWWDGFAPDGISPSGLSLTTYNGVLVVGGNFDFVGGLPAERLAFWDGVGWAYPDTPFGTPAEAIAVFEGDLIVSGGGHVSRWDGVSWTLMDEGFDGSSSGNALLVFNGNLYLGGQFRIDGDWASIAQWNGVRWIRVGPPGTGNAYALAEYNGKLFAAGWWSFLGSTRVAEWTGSSWLPVGDVEGQPDALTAYDGSLYVGGTITAADGSPVNNMARWDGGAWHDVGQGADGRVHSLCVHAGRLVAAGAFASAGGISADLVAMWDGSQWTDIGDGLTGVSVYEVADHAGILIATGEFSRAGSRFTNNIAQWNGSDWSPLGAAIGVDATVRALAEYDGSLIVGGDFTAGGGYELAHIASWNGLEWSALGGLNGSPYALAVFDSELNRTGFSGELVS